LLTQLTPIILTSYYYSFFGIVGRNTTLYFESKIELNLQKVELG